MKKQLAFILVLALLLPVLAGCQSAYAAKHTPETKATKAVATPAITRDEAVQIALKDANLTPEEIFDLEAELDKERGVLHYDVDFEKDRKDYDYEIHAETGEILRKEVPTPPSAVAPEPVPEVTPETTPAVPVEPAEKLTREAAIAIALTHAGLTKDQVRELEAELDKERGVLVFEVDFETREYDYEYEIHAQTGEILKSKRERDICQKREMI